MPAAGIHRSLIIILFCLPAVCTVVQIGMVPSARAEAASFPSTTSPHRQQDLESRTTCSQPAGTEEAAHGEQNRPEAPGAIQTHPGSPAGPEEPEQDTIIDFVHKEISRGIQGTATWMDSFFGNRRYDAEVNESYVRFRYNIYQESHADMIRKPDLQVRIILPQLKEKTHLVLSGTPKEEANFSPLQSNSTVDPADPAATGEERNVTAAVQQTFIETIRQSFAIRTGLKLHDQKPVLMLAPRYRVLLPFDSWNFRYIHEVTWISNVGWAWNAVIDAERLLPHDLFFRASNNWIWTEHVKGYLYAFSFTLGQPLGERRGLSYEWVNVFNTRPVNALTEVTLRVHYRQQLWRKWLYFDVAPQYRFPRDHSFRGIPGILFRIEMLLGNYR